MADSHEIWVIEDQERPVACMILTPSPDTLYLGKMAVDNDRRRMGLARALIDQALHRAALLGRNSVTLQTRVGLVESHAAFAALGFRESAQSAHPGYDRPTSLAMIRPLGGTGWAGGRPAKGAASP
jgi:predicted N-acetyltransferase YhbS